MDDRSSMSPGMAWALGFVCLVVGLTPILQVAGFFPIAPDSSRWVMVGVGTLFIAGGAAVVVGYGFPRGAGAPHVLAVAQYILALIITALMTSVAAWVAFAPGERHFTINVPLLPPAAVELIGRLAFGFSSFLLLGILALFAFLGARGLTSRGDSHTD
jgi:hypothetical protein